MFQGRYIFLLLLPAPFIITTLTIPVNIHRFGAQNLKCATQFGIVNANKMPGFGEQRMPCPYFLDRLPEGALSNQHLLSDFLYFPSPEEHKEPFGDSAHINNLLSFPALCFHLFIFSVRITFLRGNTVFLTEQLYIWLLKGSLIMKNPIWNQQVDLLRLILNFITSSAAVPQGKPWKTSKYKALQCRR